MRRGTRESVGMASSSSGSSRRTKRKPFGEYDSEEEEDYVPVPTKKAKMTESAVAVVLGSPSKAGTTKTSTGRPRGRPRKDGATPGTIPKKTTATKPRPQTTNSTPTPAKKRGRPAKAKPVIKSPPKPTATSPSSPSRSISSDKPHNNSLFPDGTSFRVQKIDPITGKPPPWVPPKVTSPFREYDIGQEEEEEEEEEKAAKLAAEEAVKNAQTLIDSGKRIPTKFAEPIRAYTKVKFVTGTFVQNSRGYFTPAPGHPPFSMNNTEMCGGISSAAFLEAQASGEDPVDVQNRLESQGEITDVVPQVPGLPTGSSMVSGHGFGSLFGAHTHPAAADTWRPPPLQGSVFGGSRTGAGNGGAVCAGWPGPSTSTAGFFGGRSPDGSSRRKKANIMYCPGVI